MKLRKTPIGYNLVIQEDELELCPIKEVFPLSNGYAIATYPKDEDIVCLSKQNCQAIENGYDLDELAEKKWNELSKQLGLSIQDKTMWCGGFKHGLLELLGDKKFSEKDVYLAINLAWDEDNLTTIDIIQELQQTEWDVEIVTEPMNIDEIREKGKGFSHCNTDKYKLDVKGEIILKRI